MIGDQTLANSNTIKETEEQIRRNSEKIAMIEERKKRGIKGQNQQGLKNNRMRMKEIAQQLGIEATDLKKGITHKNIAAETQEEETKEAQSMNNNKVERGEKIQPYWYISYTKYLYYPKQKRENKSLDGYQEISKGFKLIKRIVRKMEKSDTQHAPIELKALDA
ncbi:unnamed protein product (macronuclear) [Paramecium tetraurelia]|uniref:Uncharacterized protein n=1 Tax=Paramecium tetraurelia TaxID=5888 RepID=A0DX84_PARTE|nr:uncharacterized protein GSPATT00021283001 [Paramecium tetraurelia]CAK87651.1 unnamed protein product [Paramecium tetraurelia]|eukprot:XP_001455048.1 hypothetical protein (macronuclear) [Paramecium tetraurelia strain d4-2]